MAVALGWRKSLRAGGLLTLAAAVVSGDAGYRAEIEAWRAKREKDLRAESGWLSVVGLHWLEDGTHTLGSAKDNGIVLPPSAPRRAGRLEFSGGRTRVRLEPGVSASLGGRTVREAELRPDSAGEPDVLAVGRLRLSLIERGGRYALRVRDPESRARREFRGLRWFPVREEYRVEARFEPFDPPRRIPIANVVGQVNEMPAPGRAVFTLDGRELALEPVFETPGAEELFFIFKDETAPRETYGAGRYLYSSLPRDGTVVLDFNKAYSPPCAFTAFATCPLPPPQNRLPVRIEAGEKKPAH